MKKAEDELRRTGALRPEKNWPPCYPILHHDIAGEARPLNPHLNLAPGRAPQACWVKHAPAHLYVMVPLKGV